MAFLALGSKIKHPLDLKKYRYDESLWTAKISTLKMNVHKGQRDYRRYRRRMQRQSQKRPKKGLEAIGPYLKVTEIIS